MMSFAVSLISDSRVRAKNNFHSSVRSIMSLVLLLDLLVFFLSMLRLVQPEIAKLRKIIWSSSMINKWTVSSIYCRQLCASDRMTFDLPTCKMLIRLSFFPYHSIFSIFKGRSFSSAPCDDGYHL